MLRACSLAPWLATLLIGWLAGWTRQLKVAAWQAGFGSQLKVADWLADFATQPEMDARKRILEYKNNINIFEL